MRTACSIKWKALLETCFPEYTKGMLGWRVCNLKITARRPGGQRVPLRARGGMMSVPGTASIPGQLRSMGDCSGTWDPFVPPEMSTLPLPELRVLVGE